MDAQNPIIIGLVVAGATYGYMYWDNERKKDKKKQINFMIPCVAGLIAWFLASSYFDYSSYQPTDSGLDTKQTAGYQLPKPDNCSYHFVGKNSVRLPPQDVFLDLAKF